MKLSDKRQWLKEYPSVSFASGGLARKRYIRPELVIYGSLVDLTGFNGNDAFDGAIGSRQTT